MEERLSIEDIRTEFINLKKLKDIDSKLDELKDIEERIENLSSLMLAANEIKDSVKQAVNPIKKELVEIKVELSKKNEEKGRKNTLKYSNMTHIKFSQIVLNNYKISLQFFK